MDSAAVSALEDRHIPYSDWDMSSAIFDLSLPAPDGIFYSRMSASSHTRGNRYAPETTVGVLAWLEAQGSQILNGRSALNLEISKLVQYAALEQVGLTTPQTIVVSSREDIIKAYKALPFDSVITKHNRAGKGLGVRLLKSDTAVIEYLNSSSFEESVDGLTLFNNIFSHRTVVLRGLNLSGESFYALKVDTSNGFELCPADVCSLDGGLCPTDEGKGSHLISLMILKIQMRGLLFCRK